MEMVDSLLVADFKLGDVVARVKVYVHAVWIDKLDVSV
jgi:hypothetical protein